MKLHPRSFYTTWLARASHAITAQKTKTAKNIYDYKKLLVDNAAGFMMNLGINFKKLSLPKATQIYFTAYSNSSMTANETTNMTRCEAAKRKLICRIYQSLER